MEKLGNQDAGEALRERRAEVSGEIARLERRLHNLTGSLGHLKIAETEAEWQAKAKGFLKAKMNGAGYNTPSLPIG